MELQLQDLVVAEVELTQQEIQVQVELVAEELAEMEQPE
tara:strand:- start:17 stop:133 length:117 start_codon:yes stop_codon:yes gene_type:complete